MEKSEAIIEVKETEVSPSPAPSITKRLNDGPVTKARRTARIRAKRQSSLPFDRFTRFCYNAPPALGVFLIILFSGIPFGVLMIFSYTTYSGHHIGDPQFEATWAKLSKWLIITWASMCMIIPLTFGGAKLGSWLCHQSRAGTKYAPLARTVAARLTFLIWAGAAHQAEIMIFKKSWLNVAHNWTYTLREVFTFLVIAFTIIFVQGLVLQLASVRYIGGYIGPRSQRSFSELDTLQSLNNLVKPHVGKENPGIIWKLLTKFFCSRKENIFDDIRRGVCTEGQMKDYAGKIWDVLSAGKFTVSAQDISTRLIGMGRDPEKAQDLFVQLDESCDGEVSREELENVVLKTGLQLRKRADAMYGIQLLLKKLEVLLTIVMFGVIVFVYTNFFGQSWAKDVKALWTGVVALSFAFSGPVAELVNSCVFVFAKHAYDVGDVVEIKEKKLLVSRIFLTHTNFEGVTEDGSAPKVVQWSHSALISEAIVNATRSADLLEMMTLEQEC